MITASSLKTALDTVFFGADATKYKYIVPIKGGFFIPAIADPDDHTSTWIGYRLLEINPRVHALRTPEEFIKHVRVDFRLVSMGPNAEEFITSTLLWEDRLDVKDAFEVVQGAQVMYDQRRIYTKPVQQEGFSDDLVWVTDMHAMTSIRQEIPQSRWLS